MFLSLITLAVALSLSVIAAYYSIAGLAAIFAAAVIPIMIMGLRLSFDGSKFEVRSDFAQLHRSSSRKLFFDDFVTRLLSRFMSPS